MAPSLPHRVPNPPKVFVGRQTECEQLVQLLEQGAVAWVCGSGGAGKSALVRHALRVGQPSWADQAVQVSMGPTDALDDVLYRLLEVLHDAPYEPDSIASEESLHVEALNAAESAKRTIVLDDLHHAQPQVLLDLCSLLSDYALHSRWILVSREFPPGLDSPEQLLWLKPMAGEALRDLASRCGCAGPDLDEAVKVAAGSPLRLRQWVACRQQRGHLEAAPPQARQLLRLLAQFEHPVSLEHAQRLTPLPPTHILEALEHSGWLQQSASEFGLRMHDLLAADVVDDLSQAERRSDAQAIASSLDDDADMATATAAIAATVEVEDLTALSSLLDIHGARLLERGRGAWLWRQLTRHPRPIALRWAFRAATRARTADTIAWLVVQPRPQEGDLLVLWLEGQLLAARPLVVMSETEVLTCPMTAAEAAWVQLQRARAQMSVNAMDDVVETLSAVVPASEDVAAVRDALLARAYMHLGQQVRALAVMRGGPDLPLSPRLRSIVDEQRNFVVMASGHAGDSQTLLAAADSPDASTSSRLLLAGRLLMAGQLERARSIVEPLDDGPLNEGERVLLALVRCAVAMLDVRLADCRRQLKEALDIAGRRKLWMLYHSSVNTCLTMTSALRMPPIALTSAYPEAPPAANNDRVVLGVLQQFWTVDLEGAPPSPIVPDVEYLSHMGTHSASRALTEAMWARIEIVQGRFTSGDLLAVTALRRARDGGWPFVVGTALHELALTAAGRSDRSTFRQAGAELAAIGARGNMALYAQLGELFSAMNGAHPDVAGIDTLAARWASGPAACWARGMFGHAPTKRAYDRAGVVALGNLWTPRIVFGRTSDDWGDGWGYDAVVGVAWRLDGPRIKLSGRVARRLLTCLVGGGGESSKESLVRFAWEQDDYHPLRDDNRLHVAMRRLRRNLAGLDSSIDLLETTDDGYRVSPRLAFAWCLEA